jgi:hypothetical protein
MNTVAQRKILTCQKSNSRCPVQSLGPTPQENISLEKCRNAWKNIKIILQK